MRQEVIVCRGLPGSGKSTWAREWCRNNPNFVRVNRDDLRAMTCLPHTPERETLMARMRDIAVMQALQLGFSVVIDDTNLHDYHLQKARELAATVGAIVIIRHFDTPVSECIQRDAQRPTPVGETVIRRLAAECGRIE